CSVAHPRDGDKPAAGVRGVSGRNSCILPSTTPGARRRKRSTVMQPTAGRPTTASTKDVLDHHLKCFGDGNLEGILGDYSSDAVLFMPTGPLKGPDAMKPVFQAMFSEFAKPGA